MVFGTLYTFPSDHPRSIGIKAVAKANNLELRIVQEPRIAEHLEVSELGKVPAFRGEDGLKLFECVAIAIYAAVDVTSHHLLHPPVGEQDIETKLHFDSALANPGDHE
ncbi:MAG: hypothetical protein LQ352_005802 [Teloschistes flavicans]|nr:MAG: hypothetical protein LQ352_005802 [Teloschistes flavicans]